MVISHSLCVYGGGEGWGGGLIVVISHSVCFRYCDDFPLCVCVCVCGGRGGVIVVISHSVCGRYCDDF